MQNYHMGEAIRTLRKNQGITQEELSEGICSTSTLSKIENGSQVPTRLTFELLMERLGEPGYSYSDLWSAREFQVHKLQRAIMEAMEFGELETVDEKLWALRKIVDESNSEENQFYHLASLLWHQLLQVQMSDYLTSLIEVFRMTHPAFDGITAEKTMRLSHCEMQILNNIGIAYLQDHRPKEAMKMFLQLYRIQEERENGEQAYWKRKAGICVNIASAAFYMGKLEESVRFCNQALRCLQRSGNAWLYLDVFRIRIAVWEITKDVDAYYEDYLIAKKIYEALPKRVKGEENFKDCMRRTQAVMIL